MGFKTQCDNRMAQSYGIVLVEITDQGREVYMDYLSLMKRLMELQ